MSSTFAFADVFCKCVRRASVCKPSSQLAFAPRVSFLCCVFCRSLLWNCLSFFLCCSVVFIFEHLWVQHTNFYIHAVLHVSFSILFWWKFFQTNVTQNLTGEHTLILLLSQHVHSRCGWVGPHFFRGNQNTHPVFSHPVSSGLYDHFLP